MPPTNWLMTTPQVTPIRRREFIKTTVAATGAVAFPMVVPRRVFGANERLNIAAIGSGGKGQVDIDGCESQNIVALCDVDPGKAAHMFNRHAKAAKYADFRQMLEKEGKNIDAVTVSTTDHTHATAAAMARSAAGSFTRRPPGMLTKTSSPLRCSPARFSSTVNNNDRRCRSTPLVTRCALP